MDTIEYLKNHIRKLAASADAGAAKYRFDDDYEKVYEWDEVQGLYIYCCSYYAAGIEKNMREKTKIKKVEDYL